MSEPKRPEISSHDERLWRIINFFELVNIIRTGNMRVARADQFSDFNEFLGNALGINYLGWLLPARGGDVDVPQWKDSLRTSCFTSCWSRAQKNTKIWEEYSKNFEGIQIECKLDKLSQDFHRFHPEMRNSMRHNTPADEGVVFWTPIDKGDCVYVDLEDYELRIKNLAENYEQGGKVFAGDHHKFNEYFQKNKVLAETFHHNSLRVKGATYSFEHEYRFSWIARTRNSMEYDQAAARPMFPLTDDHLRNARPDETATHTFFPFDINVIEVAYLDGRLPTWQLEERRYILQSLAPHLDIKIAIF